MKKIDKAYFSIEHGYNNYFLIDNNLSNLEKCKHVCCVSLGSNKRIWNNNPNVKHSVLDYLERDNTLPKPTIDEYKEVSNFLKEKHLVYNKKKGKLENR